MDKRLRSLVTMEKILAIMSYPLIYRQENLLRVTKLMT